MGVDTQVQNDTTYSITREELEDGIIAMIAEAMVEQAKRITILTAAASGGALFGRIAYIASLIVYMLLRHHYIGAVLIAIVCVAYDAMQKDLYGDDYCMLATEAGFVIGSAAAYIYMDGKALHLCGVVLGIFIFRYVQMKALSISEDPEDILYARDVLIKEGLEGSEKIIVTTKRGKRYSYEWDEVRIAEYMESGGVLPDTTCSK